MRTPTDALRSMVRYTALALGDEWEVRAAAEKGAFQRPAAQVQLVPSIQMISLGWSQTKLLAAFTILAFPAEGGDATASQMAALDTADAIWRAFVGPGVGDPVMRPAADSHRGRPKRVPLYDYAGVPLEGPSAFAAETARDPRDFMRVEGNPEVNPFVNPDDERLYSVAANIRMSWLRSAAVPSGQPTVQTVTSGAQING